MRLPIPRSLFCIVVASLLGCATPSRSTSGAPEAAAGSHPPAPSSSAAPTQASAGTETGADFNPAELFADAVARCERGEAAGCSRLATRAIEGASPAEVARYESALERGCAKSVADACGIVAALGLRTAETPAQRSSLLADLERACASGSSIACAMRGEALMGGAEGTTNPSDLVARLKRDCESHGGSVCYSVATAYWRGFGVERSEDRAREWTDRACQTGSAYACYLRGLEHAEDGNGGAEKARPLYEKACNADLGPACYNLAHQLLSGVGGPQDVARAHALSDRACRLGDATACDFLASRQVKAAGERPDEEVRERASVEYCRLGGAEACTDAAFIRGDRAEKGGRPEAMEQVLTYLQKGCERGSVRGCNVLGHVARDALKACDAGNAAQCLIAGFVYAQGTSMPPMNGPSTPKDQTKAKAAFQKACDGGQPVACGRAR